MHVLMGIIICLLLTFWSKTLRYQALASVINCKKLKKLGFKNLVMVGSSGFMRSFYSYAGKDDTFQNIRCNSQQKFVQVVARLSEIFPRNIGYKLTYNKWFTRAQSNTLFILSIGITRSNRLHRCPPIANKALQKQPRDLFDYKIVKNSGICIVKLNDNSVVQLL